MEGAAAASDPELEVFTMSEALAERNDEQNVFTELIDASAMRMGV